MRLRPACARSFLVPAHPGCAIEARSPKEASRLQSAHHDEPAARDGGACRNDSWDDAEDVAQLQHAPGARRDCIPAARMRYKGRALESCTSEHRSAGGRPGSPQSRRIDGDSARASERSVRYGDANRARGSRPGESVMQEDGVREQAGQGSGAGSHSSAEWWPPSRRSLTRSSGAPPSEDERRALRCAADRRKHQHVRTERPLVPCANRFNPGERFLLLHDELEVIRRPACEHRLDGRVEVCWPWLSRCRDRDASLPCASRREARSIQRLPADHAPWGVGQTVGRSVLVRARGETTVGGPRLGTRGAAEAIRPGLAISVSRYSRAPPRGGIWFGRNRDAPREVGENRSLVEVALGARIACARLMLAV